MLMTIDWRGPRQPTSIAEVMHFRFYQGRQLIYIFEEIIINGSLKLEYFELCSFQHYVQFVASFLLEINFNKIPLNTSRATIKRLCYKSESIARDYRIDFV